MSRSTRRNTKSHKNTRGRKNLSMTRPKKRTYKMKSKRRTSKKNRTRRFKKRGGMDPKQSEMAQGNENPEIAKLIAAEQLRIAAEQLRIADEQFQKKITEIENSGKSPTEIARLVEIEERNRKIMQGPHITDLIKGKLEEPQKEKVRVGDKEQPITGSLARRRE